MPKIHLICKAIREKSMDSYRKVLKGFSVFLTIDGLNRSGINRSNNSTLHNMCFLLENFIGSVRWGSQTTMVMLRLWKGPTEIRQQESAQEWDCLRGNMSPYVKPQQERTQPLDAGLHHREQHASHSHLLHLLQLLVLCAQEGLAHSPSSLTTTGSSAAPQCRPAAPDSRTWHVPCEGHWAPLPCGSHSSWIFSCSMDQRHLFLMTTKEQSVFLSTSGPYNRLSKGVSLTARSRLTRRLSCHLWWWSPLSVWWFKLQGSSLNPSRC